LRVEVTAPSSRTAGLWLAGILLVALALRLWHIRHGMPFAYNADEDDHFVTRAIGMLDGDLDPRYYENPSAFTYLLLAVFVFGGIGDLSDPESAFVSARVVVALIGTLVVALVYSAGSRYFERRVGLVAAALMAVAFLPVFYAKHALNDVVALAPLTVALIVLLLVYERGRWWDWALAGATIGLATGTKYTAGTVLLTLFVAAGLRLHTHRSEWRRVLFGIVVAGAACCVLFALFNPFALLNPSEVGAHVIGQAEQAEDAKLGQDNTYGWLYYIGTLTWGFGWLPLLAAVAGAVLILRRDWRVGLLLVAFPVCFYLYMGAQGRFFGRWMLPIYPALCVLAGCAIVEAAEKLRVHRGAAVAGFTVLLCVQGVVDSVHVSRVLGREDTRTQALAWVQANVPTGAPVVVEPFAPASWSNALGRPVWAVERPFQAYQRRLRVSDIDRYRETGACWVIVASTQRGRGLKAGLSSSRDYYQALDASSENTVTFSPFADGADPVEFSYDDSFNYRPWAYERPGPVIEVHRLRECTPAAG
jgi:4-amino-4-deoxy-L-arabinose transferase-like glycosyltransferase